uniref:Uncharacterized protein n=1 Tax=Arundo donax TaxID=35708 RepID=A0A0A9FW66_ARUDO
MGPHKNSIYVRTSLLLALGYTYICMHACLHFNNLRCPTRTTTLAHHIALHAMFSINYTCSSCKRWQNTSKLNKTN